MVFTIVGVAVALALRLSFSPHGLPSLVAALSAPASMIISASWPEAGVGLVQLAVVAQWTFLGLLIDVLRRGSGRE
jgi:hypothetical protein